VYEMNCSDYLVWISLWLDGTLEEGRVRRLEAHLSECSRCRAEAHLQKNIVRALKKDVPGSLPEDFTRRVSCRAAGLTAGGRRRFRLGDLAPVLVPLAGAVLLIVFNRQIGEAVLPAMDTVYDILGRSLTAAVESIGGTASPHTTWGFHGLLHSGALAKSVTSSYWGVAVALGATAWAVGRAYAFMKREPAR
jgi:hypothetical protein